MRKAARILGLLIVTFIAAVLLFITVGGIFEGEPLIANFESLGMLLLSLLTVVSAVVAWVKVRIGAWFVLLTGVLSSIFALVTAGNNQLIAVIPFGGSLILAGVLILWGIAGQKEITK